MTRAGRPVGTSARVVSLVLAVGVSVSACTGTSTGAGHDAGQHTASHEPAAGTGDPAGQTDDHGEHHDESSGTAGDHAHDHGDETADAVVTAGPPRPADPSVECGTTVTDGGEQVVRYCDEGEARFVVGDDKDTEVDGATCEDRGALFLAHFGTNYSDDAAARGDYLGLALEEMQQAQGAAPIYALELTLDGYRLPLADAVVDVDRDDATVGLTLSGELSDGRELRVEASCHVH